MRLWPTKRTWKRWGIGLTIVVALALIANGIMAWWTEHRLQTKIAAIRAAGDPASIADLAPKPIPDDHNAAAMLVQLAPQLKEFSKAQSRFYETPVGKAYESARDQGESTTPEQVAAIREILKTFPDLNAKLSAAAECNEYSSMADYSLGYQRFLDRLLKEPMGNIRTAARFLDWRTKVLVADGEFDEAVQQGITMLRLARHYDHEPTLVNMLVACAVRSIAAQSLYDVLAAGPVTTATHKALDHELSLHEDPLRIVQALKTERALSIDAIKALPHSVPGVPGPPMWVVRTLGWTVKRYYLGALDYIDVELASVSRLGTEGHGKVGHHQAPQAPSGFGVMADLLIPATQAAYNADARTTAVLRALRIFNALVEYREEHGQEASGLADLSLPKEETIDPFSGQPLKLKHTDDGWIVYTVFKNGVDDGGDFKDLKDFGVAPPKWRLTE